MRRRDDQGAVAILVAVLAAAMFVIAALVIDLGLARDTKRQSQNAADASSLAAANVLYPTTGVCATPSGTPPPCFTDAVNAAKSYASVNFGTTEDDWADCEDASAFYAPDSECISFTDNAFGDTAPVLPTKVRVVMPTREVKTGLGVVAGVSKVPVASMARATLQPGGAGPCGLCVIGAGVHDLQNGDALVTNTSVHFNGSLALNPNGSVVSQGGTVSIQGERVDNKGTVTPAATEGVPPLPDPMSALTVPPDMQGLTLKSPANMCTGGPGIYLNPTASNCTLVPGLYVIIGGTLGGNNGIVANNVTMYFTCKTNTTPAAPRECANEAGATIDLSGNGDFTMSAPTVSQNRSIPGVSILYDRNNRQTLRLVGNGTLNLSGAVYMKSGQLDMRGNGCTSNSAIDSLMVMDDLVFSGNNACLDIDYSVAANYQMPPGDPFLDE
jgi:hypothetical protein